MSFSRLSLSITLGLLACPLSGCGPSGGGADDVIVRVSRQNNSGTYHYFREAVLGKNREYKLGSIDQSGSKDVVKLISNTPLAIGFSGMAYATDAVKMLRIAPKKGEPAVAPTTETAKSGEYPITRPLIIYTREEPRGAIKDYIDWILSEEGQKIVAGIGYVPADAKALPEPQAPDAEVAIKVTGSDTMVNLAQAWAEAYAKKRPNVSVQVAGGGSGVGISGLIDGIVDLANASRKMKASEIALAKEHNGVEPSEFIVGRDALAVYVHPSCPIDEITLDELAEIYGEGGQITTWSQLAKE